MSKARGKTIAVGIIIIALSIVYYYKAQLSKKEAMKKMPEAQQQEVANAPDTTKNTATDTAPQDENMAVEDELVLLSEELNKKVPFAADDTTQITKVSVSGKEMTYSMKTTGKYVITQSFLDRTMKEVVTDGVCNNSPAQRYYLEKGAILIFDYYNSNGKLGGTITVNFSNCK